MDAQNDSAVRARRGFVVGELLVAILLLALAISSVSALMYTVTRPPRTSTVADCTTQAAAKSPGCSADAKGASKSPRNTTKSRDAEKLLIAGCATRSGSRVQACEDSVRVAAAEGTTIRSRTDSASLQLLPKKPKRVDRPDLGFVR